MQLLRISLLLLLGSCAASPQHGGESVLTFLHMNDTYRVDAVEEGLSGGFGRVITLARALEADGHDVRFLHGGDFLFPSLESQLWGGEQMIEAMNFMDDIAPLHAVPGNHEFDPRTPDNIVARVRESRFDWLAANMRLETGETDVDARLLPSLTFEHDGRTIGIFSLTLLPEHGGNERDYTPFEDGYVAVAEREIRRLEEQGAELIIGLTHLHLGDDLEIAKLKARYPAFRFIVGGHEHEPEYDAGDARTAVVMKGASNARTIWRIDVTFDDEGPRIETMQIAVNESITLDPGYQPIADKWRARLLELVPFLESTIGYAALPLDGREVAIRSEETNWGNFIADQMLTAFRNPPAQLAFVNGGTLRIDDYVAGDITFEDIGRTFGFSSYLRIMQIDGADFVDLLEAGYRGVGPSKGYFPQVSGFRVCVDRSRPDGQRIVELLVPDGAGGWRQIDADRTYTLVAPDYLYRGGDGYDFSAARNVSRPGSELKYLVLDAVIRAQAEGRKVGAPVDPTTRRYAELEPGRERCFR